MSDIYVVTLVLNASAGTLAKMRVVTDQAAAESEDEAKATVTDRVMAQLAADRLHGFAVASATVLRVDAKLLPREPEPVPVPTHSPGRLERLAARLGV